MAKEIYVSATNENEVQLIFYIPITPISGAVPTPSTVLNADELADLTAADATKVTALDNGSLYAWRTDYRPSLGETGPQALAKVREMYSTALSIIPGKVAQEYRFASRVGSFFDAS